MTQIDLRLGDCFDIFPTINDNTYDLIFVDPPYRLSNNGFTCQNGQKVSVNKGDWDKSEGFDKDFEFHQKWITECKRILKTTGTIFISGTYHSIYLCGFALLKNNWHILNDISWFKPNASPNLSCRMFTASHENLIWAKKEKSAQHIFNYDLIKSMDFPNDKLKEADKQMRSVWSIPTPQKQEKLYGKHPTQKPLALLARVILATTNENDSVFDPFMGSGTTGVAAKKLNRSFTGIELDAEYFNIANKRINY
jgi:site-specific DNA-methyltransferase (adenine-specific)